MLLRNKYIILSLFGILFFAGCSKDSSDSVGIELNVTSSDVTTKATLENTGTLQLAGKFVLDAYLDEVYTDWTVNPPVEYTDRHFIASNSVSNVQYRNNEWSLTEPKNWVSNDMTRFWCYFPETVRGTRAITEPVPGATSTSFTYTMPTSGSTDDLLFAYASKNYNQKTDSRTIDITFHHAMSQIRIAVSTDDGTFDKNLIIKSVTLKGIPTSGTCVLSGKDDKSGDCSFVWTPGSSTSEYSETYDASFSPKVSAGWTDYGYEKNDVSYNLYISSNVFFVIPHTTSSASMAVTFESEGTQKTIEQNIPAHSWLPDHFYTYKISATTIGRDINASFTLLEWVNHDDKIII